MASTQGIQNFNSPRSLAAAGATHRIYSLSGIDATEVAVIPFPEAVVGFTLMAVVVRVQAVAGCTVKPTLGVGVATGEGDILPQQLLPGTITSTHDGFVYPMQDKIRVVSAGDIPNLGISVPATATTLTLAVDLIGYVNN